MAYVFISHANSDKPRLKHISDFLIRGGFKLWLDRPEVMGYSPEEIRRHFLRIRPGEPWESEIDDAVDRAACVLLLASKGVFDGSTESLTPLSSDEWRVHR